MNQIQAIAGLLNLFNKGQAVADPEKWKSRQITATMLSGVVVAASSLAKSLGVDLSIDPDTANSIAVTALVVVNSVLTITTSKTVGIDQKKAI